jgi:hypothetical protein
MIEYFKNWYRGKYFPPENNPGSYVKFLAGHYEQPFVARILSRLFTFWLKNWQFIVGTLVAVILAIFFNK